jgi:hypothetical protein
MTVTKLPFTEILKSVPGFFGIRLEEEPKFEVVEHLGPDESIEIRRYAPALLARVTVAGDHDEAVDEGFDRLARYIFGDNRPAGLAEMRTRANDGAGGGEQMAMTIPVRQEQAAGGWTIAFFLSNDLEASGAPQPNDPGIELVREPVRVVAVLRYRGNNSDERRLGATRELLGALADHPRWRVDDEVTWAQYDAPFVIPFMKRNEAQVAVKPRSSLLH